MLNILKKLLSSLASMILLLCITTICSIFVIRNLLSGNNLLGVLNNSSINSNIDYSSLIPTQDNNAYAEINEYINTSEITEELQKIITDYLKYSSGVPNSSAPSTDELKEIIKNSSSKYEEKTGEKINLDEINNQLDELEIKLTEENELSSNNTYKQAFQLIYNDNYIYIAVGIAIVCIVLILLLNKIEDLIKHLIVISLFNGIGNIAFGFALDKIINSETNKLIGNLLGNLTNTFNKIAITSFTISGILIVIYILIKTIKNIKNKQNINLSKKDNITSSTNTYLENNIDINSPNNIEENNQENNFSQ